MFAYIKNLKKQTGMIATLALLGVSAVTLSIISATTVLALGELRMATSGGSLEQTYYAAESGLNEALYRLIENPIVGNYSFMLDDIRIDIALSANPDNPYQRIIESQATAPNGKIKVVRVVANTDSFAGGFDYAVQGGSGGVYLDNNSLVNGDIYSNGDILPASHGATGNISGHAWAAGAHLIDKANITGNAHADTISRSNIGGEAYYQTIDAATDVGGAPCPNAGCHPGFPAPAPKPFPIDDAVAQGWKDDISSSSNPVLFASAIGCPPARASGYYCVTSDATLGFEEINADFYVGNGATLTLTGNLWVTGDIILDNNGTIAIDPGLGSNSVVIISDGIVDVNNNYIINGTGDPSSFVLVLSLNASVNPANPAVHASNNSDSIVFAAIHGMLKVKNNGRLNAAAAEEIWLEPNSEVTFNPLLRAFSIPSGGENEVGTALGTWEEL